MADDSGADDERLVDAFALSGSWRTRLDLDALTARALDALDLPAPVDLVAVGKAAVAMADSAGHALGPARARTLVVTEAAAIGSRSLRTGPDDVVLTGEHPVPGPGSLRAGRALVTFCERSEAASVLWCVSGGASSLCVRPQPPLELDDLAHLFDAALAAGADITELNQWRAATSRIAGGAVLAHVRAPRSGALVMVDNVIAGAPWVASGLTYEHPVDAVELGERLARWGVSGVRARRLLRALAARVGESSVTSRPAHTNVVVADPATMLEAATAHARELGYRVLSLGARVHGDAADVAASLTDTLARESTSGERVCVLGAGEVTVSVVPGGRGGRCQQLAALMAEPLERLGCGAVFVARASDGRDYLDGVGGAWVDDRTAARARERGLSFSDAAARCDTHDPLAHLGCLLEGQSTGWNLCDLYVALVG